MPGIDSDIIMHSIKTYPNAKPIWQRLRPVHPCKVAAIKLEVEKIIKAGFVYPVALTDWVSDPDLCRNTMKYRNTHKRRDAAEIRLHFINNK
jgi:hypothetical protein